MKQKVTVIGVGRLGLSFALLLNSKGYDVMGCDVNEKYIESLKDKSFSSNEPGVNELLKNSTMGFTTNIVDAFTHSDTIFIFVATPSKESGEYDHQYIEQVIDSLEKFTMAPYKTIVIGCTVMPGYCNTIQKRLSKLKVDIVYNPSFIAQGSICNNLRNADMVLIGGEKVSSLLEHIYIDIMDGCPLIKHLSLTGAEIAKISLNCFLTTKISFANRIAEICINSGIETEVSTVLNTIGSDKRIGNAFLGFGYGFSGVCLPRDNRALGVHANSVGISSQFQEMIDETNRQHLVFLHNYFVKANPNKDVPFVFYQLSYKKGVDILTESQPLKLCLLLLEDGYSINVIESKSVIEQAKVFLKKYENRVSYDENKKGVIINL